MNIKEFDVVVFFLLTLPFIKLFYSQRGKHKSQNEVQSQY